MFPKSGLISGSNHLRFIAPIAKYISKSTKPLWCTRLNKFSRKIFKSPSDFAVKYLGKYFESIQLGFDISGGDEGVV